MDSGDNSIFDTTQHFVTNRQGSVVAVLDEASAVSESDQSLGGKPGFPIAYVHYDTYGTPTICDPADIDRDGVVDLRDVAAYIVYWQKYHAGTAHSDRYKDILDFGLGKEKPHGFPWGCEERDLRFDQQPALKASTKSR